MQYRLCLSKQNQWRDLFVLNFMENDKEDLAKYYNEVKRCKIKTCKRWYGSNQPEDNGICPICTYKIRGMNSMLSHMKKKSGDYKKRRAQ